MLLLFTSPYFSVGAEWNGSYQVCTACIISVLCNAFHAIVQKFAFSRMGEKKEIGPITVFINHTFISIFKIIFLLELLTFTLSKAVLKGKHTCILQRLIIMFCFQTTWASCNDRGIQWVLFLQ